MSSYKVCTYGIQLAMKLQQESNDSHLNRCNLQDTSSCLVSPVIGNNREHIAHRHMHPLISVYSTFDNK